MEAPELPAGSLQSENFPATLDDIATITSHNNLLPDSLQTRAQKLLSETETNLTGLGERIAPIQTMLDNLRLIEEETTDEMNLYRSAVSALRKVPNELLSHIFTLCCDASVEVPLKRHAQQWVLGRVCSKWRQLSLSMPELWASIHFHGWSRRCAARTEELLRRSSLAPLSLKISDHSYQLFNAFEPFLPHLCRIKELCIDQSYGATKAFLELSPGLVTSLHTLTIDLYPETQSHVLGSYDENVLPAVSFDASAVLQDAPNLCNVTYRGNDVTSAWLPLLQLTHFDLCIDLSPYHVLRILSLMPNLEQCRFRVGYMSHRLSEALPSVDPAIPLTHNLHSFDIHVDLLRTDEIAGCLVLPNLRHFHFWGDDWDANWASTILRSGMLESLVMHVDMSSEELEPILRGAPNLVKLELEYGRIMSPSILCHMGNGDLVPRVTTLRCVANNMRKGKTATLEMHLDMLERRRLETTPASHITDVTFILRKAYDNDDNEWRRRRRRSPSQSWVPGWTAWRG